jgi:hypothetical protein
MRRVGWLAVLALVAVASGALAAETQQTQMDWREGTFIVGAYGAGEAVWPADTAAPDHERLDVTVSPCHRDLEVDLEYHPPDANASLAEMAEAILPYRFRLTLEAPDGTQTIRRVVDEPRHGYDLGTVDAPGTYTLQLELLEGADVDWRARVQGWTVADPTCGLWVNEIETNPADGAEQVELYHEADTSVDLSSWRLAARNATLERSYPVPDGTVIARGEHPVIGLDGPPAPDRNLTVALVPPVGGAVDASPSLTDEDGDDRTHQRSPDGAVSWTFATGTPGEPNVGG